MNSYLPHPSRIDKRPLEACHLYPMRSLSLRLPAAFALLLAGISGCSRDPPPSPAAAPTASAEATPNPNATPKKTPSGQPQTGPAVVISLERASATRTDQGVLFKCEASLVNRTGAPLHVNTNFSSPFDGLEIVVTSEDGKEIARQAYIHHQSPSADSQLVPLPPGATTQTLAFPIAELTSLSGPVNVKLAGGLPGTALRSGLLSNEVEAVLEGALEADDAKTPPPAAAP